MPVATFQRPHLNRVLGRELPMQQLADNLPLLGGEVDHIDGERIAMEYFPNRPDLLVVEGAGRALAAYLGIRPGLASYPVTAAKTRLVVDASVQAVRPFAGLCFVRNVPVDAGYVEALVDAQEKLCLSMGRRRKRVAIGLHDAKGLTGPFRYTILGPNDKPFVPLGETRSMTPGQVLAEHPKGKEYGGLVPAGKIPAFLDGSGAVLSLPPIINAQRTAITAATRDILVDVTGTDLRAVRQTLALLASCLAERGGTIEAVDVEDASGTWTCPSFASTERILHMDDAADLLGPVLAKDAAAALRKMGHQCDEYDNKLHVKSPAWRFDLLHDVDWLEDIAVGLGYTAFQPALPKAQTFGGRLAHQRLEDDVRTLLCGHGWSEARTLSLSNPTAQHGAWNAPAQPLIELANPTLAEQTVVRRRVLPSLLEVLAANRHRSLPQSLFETGYAVNLEGAAWQQRMHVAGVQCDAKAGWSAIQGLVLALDRDARLGLAIAPHDEPGFIPGRSAWLLRDGKRVGEMGELHPDTLVAFGLTAPAVAFEFRLA